MRRSQILILVVLWGMCISGLQGQIPHTLNYQGVLTEANGAALPDGNVALTFRLFDVATGGTALWQEVQQVAVNRGVFNAVLGSVTPLNLPFDKQYWLGINVGQGTELTPRVMLTASPYSLNSHSTVTEPEPGQGLTIRDAQGSATHVLSAAGGVLHKGKVTIMIPPSAGADTALVLISRNGPAMVAMSGDSLSSQSLTGNRSALAELLRTSPLVAKELQLDEVGVVGNGKSSGVTGHSYNGVGVNGVSENGKAVSGFSLDGVGGQFFSVRGPGIKAHGFPAGIMDGELQINEVRLDAGEQRILVWSQDKTVRYKTLPPSTGFDGILQGKALVVKNAGGTEVFRVDTNGTSLHKGDETFEGDVIIKGESGKGAKLVDANGETIAGFGRVDLDTDQRIGVYGKAEKPGDLAGAFEGDVEVVGEIYASSLHIVRASGDTVVHFNADGTSEHKGLETYRAGLQTPLTNGNVLRLNPTEGLTLKTAGGQFRGHMDPNGNGLFAGNVGVAGNLSVGGTLSKASGSFKIDHPLDPANKYLYHSFVESPDMMNIYNGISTLDGAGETVVELPAWFEALNKDFRYQLTAIGAPGPNLHIAKEISSNQFRIGGGKNGQKVSWQVTGIRKDAYAEKNRIPVEETKPVAERGHYLYPGAFELSLEMGVNKAFSSQANEGSR